MLKKFAQLVLYLFSIKSKLKNYKGYTRCEKFLCIENRLIKITL